MSVEQNKNVVLAYLRHMQYGEYVDAFGLLHDDLRWWSPESLPGAGFLSKQQIWDKLQRVGSTWSEPLQFDIQYVTAEDDRVAVMARSSARKRDGTFYRQIYHQLYILKDGKITAGYPFMDTLEFAKEVYGAKFAFPGA